MTDKQANQRRPFVEWLSAQRQGLTEVELDEALAELTEAVLETGKKGTVTLKVTIAPGGDGMVIVADDVAAKVPEPSRSVNIYFVDDDASLKRENPRQGKLELKTIEKVLDLKEVRR